MNGQPGNNREISVQLNVYVKDSTFKVELMKFIVSQDDVNAYSMGKGKTQKDFDDLQQIIVSDFINEIIKEKSKDKWDF